MVEDLKEEGNKLFKEGDYLHAAAVYTKAMKQDPKNAVLFSNRSAALLRLGKLAKALSDANECVKLSPDWDKAWMRKGMVLESQGQLQEALECFQKANKAAGGHPDYASRIKALKLKTSCQTGKAAKSAAEQEAVQYGEGKLSYALDRIQELGNDFPPELHLLYPRPVASNNSNSSSSSEPMQGDGHDAACSTSQPPGMAEMMVRAQHAFDAPDVLTMFVGEMRQQAEQLQATAVVLVAPKSVVSFPQTWQQQAWQYGAHDGVFVQLQALIPRPQSQDDITDKGSRRSTDSTSSGDSAQAAGSKTVLNRTWFIRLRPDKPPSEPLELGEQFALLPPLLK